MIGPDALRSALTVTSPPFVRLPPALTLSSPVVSWPLFVTDPLTVMLLAEIAPSLLTLPPALTVNSPTCTDPPLLRVRTGFTFRGLNDAPGLTQIVPDWPLTSPPKVPEAKSTTWPLARSRLLGMFEESHVWFTGSGHVTAAANRSPGSEVPGSDESGGSVDAGAAADVVSVVAPSVDGAEESGSVVSTAVVGTVVVVSAGSGTATVARVVAWNSRGSDSVVRTVTTASVYSTLPASSGATT